MTLLAKNLTGEQIQQVLDLFLYKALEPIILNSDVFDVQVSYILNLVSANRKRKPSSLPRDRTVEVLCQYLVEESKVKKFELLREARIERSFLHVFVGRVLRKYPDYLRDYDKMVVTGRRKERLLLKEKLDRQAAELGCSRLGLYRIQSISQSYLTKFYECRSRVLDHYLKMSSQQAKLHIDANGKNFDFHDVRQSILKSILLAIDKYDSNKGALTSYLNWWILNALTCNTLEHEYGIAYVIPQSHRRKIAEKNTGFMNHSVSLDELAGEEDNKSLHNVIGDGSNVFDDFEKSESDSLVMYLAKYADIRGCARLVLDIGEHFTESELDIMRSHMVEESA